MPEILAPSGSMESFYAAIEAGCDAVYLAGKMFGARGFANNFTNDELVYVINYAHLYGVKVYVTCNILIYEREVKKFLEYIEFLHKNNVDAIIMQDLGMIDLVHKTFPNLEIHGSTQMHIHSLAGAMMAKKLGLKRIVLARETPLEVIKEIKEKSNLEIEVFVHGALCASYSGMCLFSASIGPRSGNRGTCSGCCRLPYKVVSENGEILNEGNYPLSMNDLMTVGELDKLIEIGIDSFKIEGRMKSFSYVYTTVKLYKETRDNYLKTKKINVEQDYVLHLRNIFNRGTTKGFILNSDNNQMVNDKFPNHQGILIGKVIKSKNNYISIKLQEDVSIHDGLRILNDNLEYGFILNEFKVLDKQVYKGLKNQVITLKVNKNIPLNSQVFRTYSFEIETEINDKIKKKLRKVPISFTFTMKKDEKITLTVSDFDIEITLESKKAELAKSKAITYEDIKEKLEKINNTIYQVKDLKISLDDGLFIPISLINNLKREILELLNQKRLEKFQKDFQKATYNIIIPDFKEGNAYTILTDKLVNDKEYTYIYRENLDDKILKVPKVILNYDDYLPSKEYLIGELGGLNKLKNVISDYSFNVVNSYTVALLHSLGVKRVTLSLELLDNDIDQLIKAYKTRYLKNPNLELIVKTRIEVMVLKYNLSEKYQKKVKYLIDRFNNKYLVVEKNNLTYIYDYKITKKDNIEKYFDMGINYLRFEEIHNSDF